MFAFDSAIVYASNDTISMTAGSGSGSQIAGMEVERIHGALVAADGFSGDVELPEIQAGMLHGGRHEALVVG